MAFGKYKMQMFLYRARRASRALLVENMHLRTKKRKIVSSLLVVALIAMGSVWGMGLVSRAATTVGEVAMSSCPSTSSSPTVESLISDVQTGDAPLTVSFTATGYLKYTPTAGAPASTFVYSWDFNGDGIAEESDFQLAYSPVEKCYSYTTSHTFNDPGSHNVIFKINKTNNGTGTDQKLVTINVSGTAPGTPSLITNNYNFSYKGVSIHTRAVNTTSGSDLINTATAKSGDTIQFILTINNPESTSKPVDVDFELPGGFRYNGGILYNRANCAAPATVSLPAAGNPGPMSWRGCIAQPGDSTITFNTLAP